MSCSKWTNQTPVTEFLLLGMSNFQDHLLFFTGLLLMLYLLSLFGNVYIVAATNLDPQLQSPMFFFLSNLSFVDLCVTSVTVPKCLHNLMFKSFCISFPNCFAQMYLFLSLAGTECFLLCAMSYDRYVAICKPLHYASVMSRKLCFMMVVVCWLVPSLNSLLHVSMTFNHFFCGPNAVHGFFCDVPTVLELSCSDIAVTQLVTLVEGSFLAASLFFFLLTTYAWIITSILRLRSADARQKAFLTCSSHLTVVVLFYGAALAVYFQQSSSTSNSNSILASLMYSVVTPTLNPFIYSLRNNEIRASIMKALGRRPFHGL